MKIWFRIGDEESGTQTPNTHSSVRRNVRPFQVHRPSPDGSASTKIQRETWWFSLSGCNASNRPARRLPGGLARGVFRGGFGSQDCVSNRFWLKNRSYSKQRTKPSLTGTRTAIRGFGFFALSLILLTAKKRASTRPSRHMSLARI